MSDETTTDSPSTSTKPVGKPKPGRTVTSVKEWVAYQADNDLQFQSAWRWAAAILDNNTKAQSMKVFTKHARKTINQKIDRAERQTLRERMIVSQQVLQALENVK